MLMSILKRDGREVAFDDKKITDAIFRAAKSVGGEDRQTAMEVTLGVLKLLSAKYNGQAIPVEDIQDTVEKVLIERGHAKTAKAYILYRAQRTNIRETRSEMMDAVQEVLKETSRENANVGNSPSAKVLQISELASKEYYLKRAIPEKFTKAHLEGNFYIHDLGWYGKTMTCLQIPLADLLKKGFNNGHGYIRSPKGIKTAGALAAIILQSNQNDQHGGQSYAYFDRDLGVYVELEFIKQEQKIRAGLKNLGLEADEEKIQSLVHERVEDEVFQAMEGFVYNLNTMHSRAGAQVPFSSINIGTDTSREGRMITKNLLKAYERGLGKGEAPMFPNICFKVKEGINYEPEDPNYDLFKLSMKVACKRLFPNFSFQDASYNAPYGEDVAYMGCRTRVMANTNGPEVTEKRGNLSFTTINLPRLGIKANGDLSKFWKSLDEMIELTIEQLLHRYEIQKKLRVKDFPFLMGQKLYLDSEELEQDDFIENAIKHGTLSIGFIGLAETLVALNGKHHGESSESQALGLSIISHMRRKCDEATQKYSLNFSLVATPAEGLSGKFTKLDESLFGEIEGITDKDWYTNSFHVPVDYKIDAFEKINIEGPYHRFCNGGHISYVELPSAPQHNLEAFEALINAMYEADMGYAAVNFPVDICTECGFNGVIDTNVCPACGSDGKISRVRRITGYLSTLEMFNDAKKSEESNRKNHMEL
ncbi:ribonucleoside-triphosphate reductase class III catalytic subunit [Desulfonispora thiosulfatigenes DSM 11270]|uniref:Ribonucleoside-triphosphate reductase class III catalytic subunit n=1 Tax=Desulfonispora thiosulfatigenes DSM 11270 TaxID=656914 RepID=A0A1W1VT43_DESTI|nr:anaerobic ribonucleoside triphosphate reductase [Desulfonispora thiosulfatigenes]SMB96400.1 ribonucleoside-triphosphate reductase class III catalytic subunit [Desulfonispora thiosulfatigenes DSM 11270]